MLFSAFLLISSMTVITLANELTTVVNTTSGPVQGRILSTGVKSMKYAYFAGIRYGKAPVGYLRFKPPVQVEPWIETLDATVEGNKCAQMNSITRVVEGSEDCLFLNVATPVTNLQATPEKFKAVIVSIHGGGFVHGTASLKDYSPDHLLERDVVFVSIAYRLGAFGFLTLNHPNATGNAGLKDQNLALKWIQANINKFGGNPNNVTLLGQSAGAASIGFHTLSDASVGLFHGTISMSGTALVSWGFSTPKTALTTAKELGIFMGTNSTDKETLLKTFYAASTEEFVRAVATFSNRSSFLPTLEDAIWGSDVFLSTCSIDKYLSGNFSKVPQILGSVEKETMFWFRDPSAIKDVIEIALEDYPSPILSDIINSIGALETLDEQTKSSFIEIAINETTNILFRSVIDITQSILVANNDKKPVYYYHFTFSSNISIHSWLMDVKYHGAAHNDDIPYIFWYPFITDNLGPNGPVSQTIHRVSTMWTNFAKYGNPTPHWIKDFSLNVTWPDSRCSGRALEIGRELTVTERPLNLNAEIIKSGITENIGLRNGCAVTTIGH